MSAPIYFYTKTNHYFEFSNFSPHGIEVDGQYWPTVEYYHYQAMKFSKEACEVHRDRIRGCATAREARQLGQTRSVPIRPDWDLVRDSVMEQALRLKFSRPQLLERLLSTGQRQLVEASPFDYYWGAGADGSGQNRLGRLLMSIRDELRDAAVRG